MRKNYFTDGFTNKGNPSDSGGWVVYEKTENKIWVRNVKKQGFTNNEAELLGIHYACEIAGVQDSISTDSLCCLWLARKGKCKARPDLNKIAKRIKDLCAFKMIDIKLISREVNPAGKLLEYRKTEVINKPLEIKHHFGLPMKVEVIHI